MCRIPIQIDMIIRAGIAGPARLPRRRQSAGACEKMIGLHGSLESEELGEEQAEDDARDARVPENRQEHLPVFAFHHLPQAKAHARSIRPYPTSPRINPKKSGNTMASIRVGSTSVYLGLE